MHPDYEKKAKKTVEVRAHYRLLTNTHLSSVSYHRHVLEFSITYASFTDVILQPQRANILKEVSIMRNLDHPNIVQLVEFSESRQYYYIILELCPGGELFHQIVRLTYFSEDLSRHVIVQVAKALE